MVAWTRKCWGVFCIIFKAESILFLIVWMLVVEEQESSLASFSLV